MRPWDRRRYRKDTPSQPSQCYVAPLKEHLVQMPALEPHSATEERLLAAGFTRLPDVCDEQAWVGPGVPEEDVAALTQIMTNAPEGN